MLRALQLASPLAVVTLLACEPIPADAPTRVCPSGFSSRDAVPLGDVVVIEAGDGFVGDGRFFWEIVEAPEGSAFEITDDEAHRFAFEPDAPGLYVFRLSAFGDEPRDTRCAIRAVEGFEGRFLPEESTHTAEEFELQGGGLGFSFFVNQDVSASLSALQVTPSDDAYRLESSLSAALGVYQVTALARIDDGDPRALDEGDVLEVRLPVEPRVLGAPAVLEGTLEIVAEEDPGSHTPRPLEVRCSFEPDPPLLYVRFDEERPMPDLIEVGGFTFGAQFVWGEASSSDEMLADEGWLQAEMDVPPRGEHRIRVRGMRWTQSEPARGPTATGTCERP